MRYGTIAALAALMVAVAVFSPGTASSSEGFSISLNIPGEAPVLNGEGQPVLVAGIWHDLTLNLESPTQNHLTLEASSLYSGSGYMTSHYLWERDEANDTWSDPLYGFFVEPDLSRSEGQTLTFRLGVDATATAGKWELKVNQDGAAVGQRQFEVQDPVLGYGLSSADFNFRTEPFKEAEFDSEDLGQYLRVANHGNVPLRMSVSFDKLQSRISLTNPSDIVHVNDGRKYFIRIDLDPRPPQIIQVKGISRVELTHLIPSPGASRIIPAVEEEFGLRVIIGRSGYAVRTVGEVIFQTLDSLTAAYGSLVTWQVFLTGDEQVSLDVEVVDAQLIGVLGGDEILSLPAILNPTPNAELPLTLQVLTVVPSTAAEVIFTLTLVETGEVTVYKTTITVGAKPPSPPLQPSLMWFFASLVSASVLAITTYNHWKFVSMGPSGLRQTKSEPVGKAGRRPRKSDGGNPGRRGTEVGAQRKARPRKGQKGGEDGN